MRIGLRRREFIAGLGGAAAWPLAVRGQQRAMPVVGWLSTRNSETDANVLPAFRRGLNKQGYVEGRNVTTEYRWSDTQNDLLPALAEDLVRLQVAVLVTAGDGEAVVRAIRAITTTLRAVVSASKVLAPSLFVTCSSDVPPKASCLLRRIQANRNRFA
jgi:putative ABC transport system substrate-binding protein